VIGFRDYESYRLADLHAPSWYIGVDRRPNTTPPWNFSYYPMDKAHPTFQSSLEALSLSQ